MHTITTDIEAQLRARWARLDAMFRVQVPIPADAGADLRAMLADGLGMGGSFEDFYAAQISVRCDRCGAEPPEWPQVALVHCTEGQRVSVTRGWTFCTEACLAAWFAAGDVGDYHPIDPTGADHNLLNPGDAGLTLSLVHFRGPLVDDVPMQLRDADTKQVFLTTFGRLAWMGVFTTPAELNAWWQTPGALAVPDVDEAVVAAARWAWRNRVAQSGQRIAAPPMRSRVMAHAVRIVVDDDEAEVEALETYEQMRGAA